MLLSKRSRIAYFYDQFDNSTFRYRVYNPCQTINAHATLWSASFFFLNEQQHFESIVRSADILVLCRVKYCPAFAALLAIIRAHGKKVVYDIDDLVFDISLAHFIANNNGCDLNKVEALDGWFAYVARMRAAMQMCDRAIATNSFLASEIESRVGLDASVMRNYLNKEQMDYSEEVVECKMRQPVDGAFKIGYFSGSPSHEHDFSVVRASLIQLMKEYPHVELVLVGYVAHMMERSDIKDRVTTVDFHDYVNLQRVIGSVDLNIVPLQNNVFTNCKSELKYFEASIVLTPTLATPIYTFSSAIRDGEDGYLCGEADWFEKMQAIIESGTERLSEVAVRGRQKCLEQYGWERVCNEVLSALL